MQLKRKIDWLVDWLIDKLIENGIGREFEIFILDDMLGQYKEQREKEEREIEKE